MANDIEIIKSNADKPVEKGIEVCIHEDNIRTTSKNARNLFSSLQCELDEIEGDIKDGLSYLDMKNDTLLSYMIDLCNIVLKKVRGEAISGHPSIKRSVYYRVILEKIKAIDQRLAYQLNKVITMPDDLEREEQGVNINNLDVDLESDVDDDAKREEGTSIKSSKHKEVQYDNGTEDEDEVHDKDSDGDGDDDVSVNSITESGESVVSSDDETPEIIKKSKKKGSAADAKKPLGIYKPPKLRSVAYDDGINSRKRRDHTGFYQDDNDNMDIVDEFRSNRDEDRVRYEEDNYTRLPAGNSNKTKRKMREKKAKGKRFKGSSRRK